MIKFFISILVVSICYGKGDLQERMIQLSKDLQKQLNFQSISQMNKQKELSPNNTEQTSTRDADDLIGSWEEVERNSNAYITVGQDQSIQDAMTLMGMKEAEGSLTATTDDFITELKYILDLSNMEGDDNDDEDDSTYSYGPRIGALLTDLDPGSGGSVYFDDTDTDATITFVDVPKFDNLDLTHTFQIQLIYESNKVVLSYKDLSLSGSNTGDAYGGLAIGISDGSGEYDEVDFSTISEESYTYPVEAYSIENQLDLAYTKVTFSPNGDFSEYTVSQESITDLPGLYGNVISVEDDDYDFNPFDLIDSVRLLEKYKKEKQNCEVDVTNYTTIIGADTKAVSNLQSFISGKTKAEARIKTITKLESKLESNITKSDDDISFFQDHDDCPTCKQAIDLEFKNKTLDNLSNSLVKYKDGLKELETKFLAEQKKLNVIL